VFEGFSRCFQSIAHSNAFSLPPSYAIIYQDNNKQRDVTKSVPSRGKTMDAAALGYLMGSLESEAHNAVKTLQTELRALRA
jgi:hypothetical protein